MNSIQTAEKITATFTYGDGVTVSNKCSASDYVDMVRADTSLDEENVLRNLVNAIKDYGHYVQIPLAAYHEWTIGTDYAKMDEATTYDASTVEAAKTAVSSYALKNTDTGNALISSVGMDLELNSETTLNIYITCSSEAILTAGNGVTITNNGSNKYTATISGISAHLLAKSHTIHVSSGGNTYDVTASALSYVHSVLNEEGQEKYTGINNAVTALYNYYKATMAYRESDYWKNN